MTRLLFPSLISDISDISIHDLSAWLPSPDRIVHACDTMCEQGEPDRLLDLLQGMGASTLDMVVTPLSARAALLAASNGHAFYHHELRGRIPMPAELEPEITVWDQGTVPIWREGILTEPKYFSFFQDTPLPAYNPNYRRKWRPHELLHGTVRFFWHPQMTRFEMYISSRLNELLPVVHWYGLDEIFRPRCKSHDGQLLYRDYCAQCEQAAVPYWQTSEKWRAKRIPQAVQYAEQAWTHLNQEWQAILNEIQTGQVHEVNRPYLNSSSDAIGYMRAHWNRVTAWSFGQWMEMFMVPGLDYYDSLDDLLGRSAHIIAQLISGDINVNPLQFEALRARRTLQDIAYRTLIALEWLDADSPNGQRAEDALMPVLESAADLCHALPGNIGLTGELNDHIEAILLSFDDIATLFPKEVCTPFHQLGYSWYQTKAQINHSLPYIIEGLEGALPHTMQQLEQSNNCFELVRTFIQSPSFNDLGRLSKRFHDWIVDANLDASSWREWLQFEAWSAEEPHSDNTAELFGSLPQSRDDLVQRAGRIIFNTTLRRASFSSDFIHQLTGEYSAAGESHDSGELAAIYMRGELRLIILDHYNLDIFNAINKAHDSDTSWITQINYSALENLMENGFIVWYPNPGTQTPAS